ncbi:MAG TPA: NADH-quinone oxidoreductase subunit L [Gaiellaceae bacterium]|jgi:NADH-quinone oxidoreductase subunit L|nr:NADH-quinone oxidoreductase subunit L [Gaiellaceae bacterium]
MSSTAMTAGSWLCLVSPLAGTIVILLAGTRIPRVAAGWISTSSVVVAFAGAVWAFFGVHSQSGHRGEITTAWTWLASGSFHPGLQLLVDPLSIVMMLIVSGVGSLIVLYSIGYMHGDDEERRYFAYMSFFVFSMLMLVEGGNLLLLLVGWGLVGLSSYLLIGFWHERPSAVQAAKKAFVMNAFGDAVFALALFILIAHSGSVAFSTSFATVTHLSPATADFVALGLLGGAVAKSAQIPLQTWLPDAMEGPTPVSALIHAATMVTAGVYLIARTHPIFEQARTIELLAAGTGALTLVVAGLIALVQTDIKRVIAYSTMSQIGYMFLGVGVGAYSQGMFHLLTHAFFKALLFMAAGLVIHAVANEQDIRKLRGVGRLMPITKWCFLAGALALVGIPPFSGFFSKDSIVAAAAALGTWYGWIFWACGVAGALLTGLYTFRLWFLVFPGEPSAFVREHFHRSGPIGEGALTMLVPVGVLAVLATGGGWLQWAPKWHPFTDWLASAAPTLAIAEPSSTQEYFTSAATVIAGVVGIAIAWAVYSERRIAIPHAPFLRRTLEHKFWFDELYAAIFYKPAELVAAGLRREFEEPVVLQTGTDLGETTLAAGGLMRRIQTGLLRTYVLFLAGGAAAVVLAFLIAR